MYKLSIKNLSLFFLLSLNFFSLAKSEIAEIDSTATMLQDVLDRFENKEFEGKKAIVLLDLDDFLGTYVDFPEALYKVHYAAAKKQDKSNLSKSLFRIVEKEQVTSDLAKIVGIDLAPVKDDREMVYRLFTALRYMSPGFIPLDSKVKSKLEELKNKKITFHGFTSRAEELQVKLSEIDLKAAELDELLPIENINFCGRQSKAEKAESDYSDYDLLFFGDDKKSYLESFLQLPSSEQEHFLYWLNSEREEDKIENIRENIGKKWSVENADTIPGLLELYQKVRTKYFSEVAS